MPDLTYSTPVSGAGLTNPADKTEIEGNFGDIATLLNGGLDNSNMAPSAAIATSKLAQRDYEFLVPLSVRPTTAVAPPTSAAVPIIAIGLPGDETDGVAYTVLSGSYIISDAGTAGNTTFNIEFGYYAAGAWVQVGSNIVNATNIAGGTKLQSGSLTITTSALSLSNSQQRFIGLMLTALGTNALDEVHVGLDITLKLRRTSGLRGT